MQQELNFCKPLSVGNKVRHKLSGDILYVKKISETIAVCRRHEPIKSRWLGMETETWTAICAIENLEIQELMDKIK